MCVGFGGNEEAGREACAKDSNTFSLKSFARSKDRGDLIDTVAYCVTQLTRKPFKQSGKNKMRRKVDKSYVDATLMQRTDACAHWIQLVVAELH